MEQFEETIHHYEIRLEEGEEEVCAVFSGLFLLVLVSVTVNGGSPDKDSHITTLVKHVVEE